MDNETESYRAQRGILPQSPSCHDKNAEDMKTLTLFLGFTICVLGNSRADEKPLQKAIQIPLRKSAAPKQILAQIPLKTTEEIQSTYSFYDGKLNHNVWMIFQQPRFGTEGGVNKMFVFDEKKKSDEIVYRKMQVFSPLYVGAKPRLFYLNSKGKKGLALDGNASFLYAFPTGLEGKQMFVQDFTYAGEASFLVGYNYESVDEYGFLEVIQQSGIYDDGGWIISDERSWLWNGKGWTNPNQ